MAQGTRATVTLRCNGIQHMVHPYDHDPATTNYGEEAVAGIGADPDQVFKTLVVDAGGTLFVAVIPVSTQLDLKAMATACGVKKVAMADLREAERATGYVAGGISPIAQRSQHKTIIDETAQLFDTINVSAGQRGLQVELSPADLAQITNAIFADIGR